MTRACNSDQFTTFAALVGIDWADQKHDLCLLETASRRTEQQVLDHRPEELDQWAIQLRERFGGRPVGVCLEQSRGPLIYALMKYEFLVLYPIAPKRLAKYRQAMTTSGAKDDPSDATLLLDYLDRHRDKLVPWQPEDPRTRQIALLAEARRKFVDLQTQLSNALKAQLKAYFPQAIGLLGDNLTTRMACDFLRRWRSLEKLQATRPETIRRFYYGHNCRRGDRIEARLAAVRQARPLCTDPAVIAAGKMIVTGVVAQLRPLIDTIARVEKRLQDLMAEHPDAALFTQLPGAGKALAPRLLAAFGTDRRRIDSAASLQTFSGIAPITRRSGKRATVQRRLACPKFLKQTFHEFADHSRKKSAWARAYYDLQRSRGKGHNAALRALAFKWMRVLFRCWQNRRPYDEGAYLEALRQRNSPLLSHLPSAN